MSEQGNHVFRIWKIADLLPILFKDLKMMKLQIRVTFDLEISKKLNQMNKSVQVINNYIKIWKQTLNVSKIGSLKHLKIKKNQIKVDFYLEISKLWEQVSKSVEEINNCMKNLEKKSIISEIDLLKMLSLLKNLKFVNFEENKYFYRVLNEEDGIYKGIIGLGQDNVFIKEGKGNKQYKDGSFFEGEWKNNKREGKGIYKWTNGDFYEGEWKSDEREGKGILKLQLEKFMKGNEKVIKEKEKEFINERMGIFMKGNEKVMKEKEKEF